MTDSLTPADIAILDQAHAAGNADIDDMLTQHRQHVDTLGTTLACAGLAAELQTSDLGVNYLAALAALAITRLTRSDAEVDQLRVERDWLLAEASDEVRGRYFAAKRATGGTA